MNKQHEIYLESFLDNCRRSNKSEHTLLNYRTDLAKFIHWFEYYHGADISIVGPQIIASYLAYLAGQFFETSAPVKKKWWEKSWSWVKQTFNRHPHRPQLPIKPVRALAVSSRRRHLSAIKNFFEYLKEEHLGRSQKFIHNPVRQKLHGIRLKDQDVEHTVLLKKDDWKALLDWSHRPRERLMIHLLYYGGLRLSELAALKWDDFYVELKAIKLIRKGGYRHTLFLHQFDSIYELLQRHRANLRRKNEFVFPGRFKGHLSSKALYDLCLRLFRTSRCPTRGLTPHSFRKACATNLYYKTKDLLLVRDYLNHQDAKITQTYIEKKGQHDLLRGQLS